MRSIPHELHPVDSRAWARWLWVALLTLGMGAAVLRAQEPLVLDRADLWDRVRVEGVVEHRLRGHVRAHRGQVSVESERARYREGENRLDLQDRVYLHDPRYEVWADELIYLLTPDLAQARGAVRIRGRQTGSELVAPTVDYHRARQYFVATGRPQLTLVPRDTSGGTVPYRIEADRIEQWGEDRVRGMGSFTIQRHELSGHSDSAEVDLRDRWIYLRETPELQVEGYQIAGTEIDIHLEGEEVKQVLARGPARATNLVEQRVGDRTVPAGWIVGDRLTLDFVKGQLISLLAEGHAKSFLNFTGQEPASEGPRSENYVLGEKIQLLWQDGELVLVNVTGGSTGVVAEPPPGQRMNSPPVAGPPVSRMP